MSRPCDLLVADPRIEPPDVYWPDRDSDAVCEICGEVIDGWECWELLICEDCKREVYGLEDNAGSA